MSCKDAIGDWFISDLKREERESELLDAEIKREQQAQLTEYMSTRAMSGSPVTNNNKYIILGGLAVLMFAIIILKG